MSDLWEHIDLCSGIGGFSLGFQLAELSEPILFCELDEFCQKILKKHWPNVPICNDVKELANDTTKFIPRRNGRKRILTSGFPCQPWSIAGAKRGKEDPRHIWPWIIEIVAQERPELCVFENVPNLATLGGLDEVIVDLANENYATTTLNLSAFCAAGAPHKRERLWIIARNMADTISNAKRATYRSNQGERQSGRQVESISQGGEIRSDARNSSSYVADTKHTRLQNKSRGKFGQLEEKSSRKKETRHQSTVCTTSGGPNVSDTSGIRGQNVSRNDQENVEKPSEKENVKSSNFCTNKSGTEDVADTNGEPSKVRGQHQPNERESLCWRNDQERSGTNDWRKFRTKKDAENVADTKSSSRNDNEINKKHGEIATQEIPRNRNGVPDTQRSSNGQPEERKQATKRGLGRGIPNGLSAWMDEPVDIPRVASGQKNRTHRLKALGNAIVPQICQRIGIAIKESF